MSFFNKLADCLTSVYETTKIIDREFSITEKLTDNFAKNGTNPKISKPVKEIMEMLDRLNIKYESEKTFPECRNLRALPFDFCIYDKRNKYFLIEYDGIQHYKPCFGLNEEQKLENYNYTKHNDSIKNQYCKDHNITLYRIAYNENHIDKVTEILKSHKML